MISSKQSIFQEACDKLTKEAKQYDKIVSFDFDYHKLLIDSKYQTEEEWIGVAFSNERLSSYKTNKTLKDK